VVAKRLLALLAAAGLIVAAVLIRSNVIDADDEPSTARPGTTLVCLTELRTICDAAAASVGRLTVTTIAPTADPPAGAVLVTFDPLPAAIDLVRTNRRDDPFEFTTTRIASSQLALVTRAGEFEQTCPAGDWRCLGDHATTLRPAFAPLSTGIGQISVAAVVRGWFGASSIIGDDVEFARWATRVKNVVPTSQLSGGTPIGTIQTARPAVGVAVGAEAEVLNSRRGDFRFLYADPMTRYDIVLAEPAGARAPDGLATALAAAAADAGWSTGAVPGTPPTASDLVAATAAWGRL